MPLLKIQTNQNIPGDKKNTLIKLASALVAEQLGKPESYVMVILEEQQTMLFAGNDQATAYLELKSIGLPQDRTATISQALCQFMASQLEIPMDRTYIEFNDAARHLWGWNGQTF
jgi:phenylpyruvate tautomerase PptA (4-oxalocrotonate tautomerase family)